MADWREQYKPGDWVELRCVWLKGGENDWEKAQVSGLSEDSRGPVVVVNVNGLVALVRDPKNIRADKPPRLAKKRLRVPTGTP